VTDPAGWPPAGTIDDVLARLDGIVEKCLRDGSRLGYFAALYRSVTRRVRDSITAGRFEDGPRMERLDVIFANRYLDAVDRLWKGETPTRSWQLAFRAAKRRRQAEAFRVARKRKNSVPSRSRRLIQCGLRTISQTISPIFEGRK